MSYIPPHKRDSKVPVTPSHFPDSLVTKSKKSIDLKITSSAKVNHIAYSRDAITKWFLIGSNGIEDEVPPSIKLVPVSSECRYGEHSMVLMNPNVQKVEESEEEERTQWMLIAEKVENDLVSAYEQAKKGMEDYNHTYYSANAKLRLVARFGKIIFYRHHQAGLVDEHSPKNLRRIFSSDVPTSFIQNIKSKAIPSHAFCKELEKELYVVQTSHYTRPHLTIRCKCTVKEDGRLSMYKAELNPLWFLVVDVSCIDKNLDMRLMLAGKRKIMALTEKEMSNIQGLLDLATVDPNAKGGLRWGIGENLSGNGYQILEVCRVRATSYKNQTLGLKVRETDSFIVRYGTREIERGVTLILREMNTKLQGQSIESGCVLEMLREALGTIWDFLS